MTTVATGREPRAADGPPIRRGVGRAVLDGNELIVKGALEAGVSLITGYPGSPVADVFSICEAQAPYLRELGTEAQLANNEAQSAAMLNGARQVPGARALAVMKSVGAYVALDGLAIANAARPAAGAAAVVVAGDDPALSSTQVGADSRLTFAGARIPVLEPASAQELKDLVAAAFDLSARSELIVGLVCTTPQADGAGVVDLLPNRAPAIGPRSRVALDTASIRAAESVSLPPNATALEADLLDRRIALLHRAARAAGLDRIEAAAAPGPHPLGIVTAGASYALLRGALEALGIDGEVPILRLGLTWPVDARLVRRFADGVDDVVVMEERSPHLEDQVRRALEGRHQAVWGKRLPGGARGFPEASGMDPDIALAALGRLVLARPDAFPADAARRAREAAERRAELARRALDVTPRTPTYCAGCPHRGTSSPMLEIRRRLADARYMKRVHGRGPVDVIAHGGIGCYSMAFLPPFEEMHNLSAMGLGGATGAGRRAPRHQQALRARRRRHVLPRRDVHDRERDQAAPGHPLHHPRQQEHGDDRPPGHAGQRDRPDGPAAGAPGDRADRRGDEAGVPAALQPRRPRRPHGPDRAGAADGRDAGDHRRQGVRDHVGPPAGGGARGDRPRAGLSAGGHPLQHRRGDLRELPRVHDRHRVPRPRAREHAARPEGRHQRGRLRRRRLLRPHQGLPLLRAGHRHAVAAPAGRPAGAGRAPRAAPSPHARPCTGSTSPGVGGMGIGIAGRILIEAAAAEWPAVEVYHRKGLAQRGGGVFSHVTMHDGEAPRTAEIPEGAADLILGLEPLEAARALRLASPDRTAAAVDTHRRPTTTVLTGAAGYPDDLVERANAETRPGGLVATDFTAAARGALGDARCANVAVLGAAWQRGWIPVGRESMEAAIRRVAARRADDNLRAFLLGRVLAAGGGVRDEADDAEALIARELGWMRGRARRVAARAFAAAREAGLGERAMRMLAPRLPEIVAWGGPGYAERYLAQIDRVREAAPALIPAAIHNLHRTMAIKDEVFVAHQLTSAKKYARDRERFGVDRARGDRIAYVHLNRPAFDVLGRHLEWDMETRDWQLRLVRRARFLRRLLPSWHRRERAFRDWYEDEVVGAVCDGRLAGSAAEEALRLPESVTGFREVRYPKEDAARARLSELLAAAG